MRWSRAISVVLLRSLSPDDCTSVLAFSRSAVRSSQTLIGKAASAAALRFSLYFFNDSLSAEKDSFASLSIRSSVSWRAVPSSAAPKIIRPASSSASARALAAAPQLFVAEAEHLAKEIPIGDAQPRLQLTLIHRSSRCIK